MVSEPYIRMHPAVGPGTTHVLKWVSLSQALQGPGRAGRPQLMLAAGGLLKGPDDEQESEK